MMQVHIVSAEREIYSGQATMLAAPAERGEVGILPHHAPFLTRIIPGTVRVLSSAEQEEDFYVSGGFLEVQPKEVTILADTAVRAKDLDEAAAVEAKRNAEQSLQDQSARIDFAKARAELARAVAQLNTIKRLRELLK